MIHDPYNVKIPISINLFICQNYRSCEKACALSFSIQFKKKTDNVRTKATMWRICVTFCCRAKETSINYSECMSVVLFTSKQSECAELYYYLWSAQQRHIFPHYLASGKSFGEKIY